MGAQLGNKIVWSMNTGAVYKTGMNRLYFLSWLQCLQQDDPHVLLCHVCVFLFFFFLLWFAGELTLKHRMPTDWKKRWNWGRWWGTESWWKQVRVLILVWSANTTSSQLHFEKSSTWIIITSSSIQMWCVHLLHWKLVCLGTTMHFLWLAHCRSATSSH